MTKTWVWWSHLRSLQATFFLLQDVTVARQRSARNASREIFSVDLCTRSERQQGSNTLHSPDSLTDIWPPNSQLKRFKLSNVAEPRRQSDPEGGSPCSLLLCLFNSISVQALIWWSERLFLLSLSGFLSLTQTQCGSLAPQYSRALRFLQNFTRLEATQLNSHANENIRNSIPTFPISNWGNLTRGAFG